MPIKYAIESATPLADLRKQDNGVITNRYSYTLVPQAVAENDSQNGVSAVFNAQDKQISPWIRLDASWVKNDIAKIKHIHSSHEDRMGNLLAVDDYVLTSIEKSSMVLCRVIGFTAKFVKVHDLHKNRVVARDPELMVKVDKSIIPD